MKDSEQIPLTLYSRFIPAWVPWAGTVSGCGYLQSWGITVSLAAGEAKGSATQKLSPGEHHDCDMKETGLGLVRW